MTEAVDREIERLGCLRSTGILDSGKARTFDAIVELACSMSGQPISLVTLVDADRQWFKASYGVPFSESTRQHAFCSTVVDCDAPLVVTDAAADTRFAANVLVSEHGVRFYAGVPLHKDGHAIGALCVMGPTAPDKPDVILHNLALLSSAVDALIVEHSQHRAMADLRRELELREARFKQTEKAAKVGGFQVDLDSGVISWSDQVYRNVGLPIGTALSTEVVLSCYAPEELAEMKRRLSDNSTGIGRPTNRHYRIITPQGEERWMHVVTEVESVDGKPRRTFGIVQDVSDLYRNQRLLEQAAVTDPLTGLGNRTSFNQHVNTLLGVDGSEVGLLLVDVDRFKTLNDTLGHAVGDLVLVELAKRLQAVSTLSGTRCFRLGGDEFAVVFSAAALAESMEVFAQDLIARSAEPLQAESSSVVARVSVGGAIWREGLGFDGLCQNADFALYHAKETRRGGFVMFEDGLRTRMSARLNALRLTEQALDEDRLLPYYQPIFDLNSHTIAGVEALVRLQTPDGRLMAAAEFFDALNDHTISHRVTSLMLERVAQDLQCWHDNGWYPAHVGINVSPADFNHGDLEERLDKAFSSRGLALDGVILEITESVFLDRSNSSVVRMLNRLRQRGVVVALDDFGTGFASLTHLRTLPVDVIKIDKSFIESLLSDRSSLAIVELVHGLARRLALDVVAEGVETEEQAAFLADLGCHYGQGYFFARPMSANALQLFARKLEMSADNGSADLVVEHGIQHLRRRSSANS
ncbi:putative bifunctional diguanylate cyclase/phosphodiesterase [Oryzibacter oryziterrae]|uniref:putative bifunctional diguanylate cyclase/phosphodiesterase n=1 Tax=Oryzibacter oryziterrae TaxID=2766474 RepID=UPI001F3DC75E|nr:EAL domain-containing protein [Oryzibacter oryziterrae]